MARSFSYRPGVAPAGGKQPHIRVSLNWTGVEPANRSTHLNEMARRIPLNTVGPTAKVLAAMEGASFQAESVVDGEAFVIPLPPEAVSEPWRLAVLFNVIDFSVAQDDPDIQLLESVVIHADGTASSVDQCFADLADRLARTREWLKQFLPEDFWLDDYEEDNWPEEADEYAFDIEMSLERALPSPEAARLSSLLAHVEEMIAWMAFSLDGSAPDWQEAGSMLYGGEATIEGGTIRIAAERPPSDISLAVAMIARIAEYAFGAPVSRWTIEIAPM
ncbi:MAG: hypothetical protein K5872_17560 [Rhizobiaceae bacterium]|nr:hypothetical protein [Rhizobiaceae bacterium]MCV0408033.1 hypothetical protein [Rhizobiaceae bacterium]